MGSLTQSGIEQAPQLRALPARLPGMARRAQREDALLGVRLILVAPAAAQRDIEAGMIQRRLQRFGQQQPGVFAVSVSQGIDLARRPPSRCCELAA
jgi:hypothetical protein